MDVLKDHSYVTTIIKNISEKEGLKNFNITDVITNKKGEGFTGLFFLVTVKDNFSDKQLHFAIKTAFTEDTIRKVIPVKIEYENEIYFYSKVYPLLKQFEKNHGTSQTVEFVPKCFEVFKEAGKEVLVLENLKISGFEVFDKTLFLDHDHISLIFKTYGRFHAYSFALRDRQPEEFQKLVKNFYNVYEDFINGENSLFKSWLEESYKLVREYLKPGEDDEILEKIENLYGNERMVDNFRNLTSENTQYPAILHGDCWSNNMMFKYDKSADVKKLTDMRLIDWQLIKIGSPVCDLSYCLYSGASLEVIDNLYEYLKIYHESLSSFLKELGCDPEKLFPFNALVEEWKRFGKFGVMMGLSIWKMKMTDGDKIVDFTDEIDPSEFTKRMFNAKFDEDGHRKMTRGILYHLHKIHAF